MKYLIALIFVLLPAYLIRFNIAGIPTTLLELYIYLIFIIGFARLGYSQWRRLPDCFWLPTIILVLAAAIGVIVSSDKLVALGQFKAFFIDPVLVLFLVISYFRKEDLWLFVSGLGLSSLFVSTHAIYQKIIGQVASDGRIVGIFGYNPNYLAFYLAPISAMILIWLLINFNKYWQSKKYLILIISVVILFSNFIAIILSESRGGVLAFVGGLTVSAIFYYRAFFKKLWAKTILILIAALVLVSLVWFFKPNFSLSPENGGRVTSSNNIRYEIWKTSVELIDKYPVFGLGLGNFQDTFTEYTKNRVNFPEFISPLALSPHNILLAFYLNTGLLGLIAFVFLLVCFFKKLFKQNQELKMVVISGMLVILIHGLVDTPYFKNDLSILFWGLIAFMIILNKEDFNL